MLIDIFTIPRIDFEDFTINGPSNSCEFDDCTTAFADTNTSGGKCQLDTLVIAGASDANANVPTICGQNTGQHSMISFIVIFVCSQKL